MKRVYTSTFRYSFHDVDDIFSKYVHQMLLQPIHPLKHGDRNVMQTERQIGIEREK